MFDISESRFMVGIKVSLLFYIDSASHIPSQPLSLSSVIRDGGLEFGEEGGAEMGQF